MPKLRRTAIPLGLPCVVALALLVWHRDMPVWREPDLVVPEPLQTVRNKPVLRSGSVTSQDHATNALLKPNEDAHRRFPQHGLFAGSGSPPASAESLQCHTVAGRADSQQVACLPLVLGISCVHCGSSSLAAYLNAHPQLSYGLRKEHHFFPDRSNLGRSDRLLKYSNQFLLPAPAQGRLQTYGLDFTPGYLSKSAMDKRVISQVAELPEETRFLVLLMPAKEFMRGRLREKATYACLQNQQCWQEVRKLCCQHLQLEPWLAQFDRRRFFFVRSTDLAELPRRQPILDNIAEFLGVTQYTYPEKVLRYEGNVGLSQRKSNHSVAKSVKTGSATEQERGRSTNIALEEEQVLERGLGDCDTSLLDLLGKWNFSIR